MPKRSLQALTKRIVDSAAPGGKDEFLWCARLPGFGLRVYPSGRKVFIAQVRVGREQRRIKVGDYGPFTVEQARTEADGIIRAASKGEDPAAKKKERREALTVAELCDLYMEAANAGRVITRFGRPKKPSTIMNDRGRIERHIKPLIGNRPAKAITSQDVQRLMDDIAAGKTAGKTATGKKRGMAVVRGGAVGPTRTAELIGGIWSWARKRGHVTTANILLDVDKVKSDRAVRVLTTDELKRLGDAMRAAEAEQPLAAAALRLIALTGTRPSEIVGMTWDELDVAASCLRLGDSKTGRSMRALGAPAVAVFNALPRLHDSLVFPNRNNDRAMDAKKRLTAIFDAAKVDASPKALRSTFASTGAELGYGDGLIGDLLGHASRGVTAQHYINRPAAGLVTAATAIASRIEAALDGRQAEVIHLNVVRGSAGGA